MCCDSYRAMWSVLLSRRGVGWILTALYPLLLPNSNLVAFIGMIPSAPSIVWWGLCTPGGQVTQAWPVWCPLPGNRILSREQLSRDQLQHWPRQPRQRDPCWCSSTIMPSLQSVLWAPRSLPINVFSAYVNLSHHQKIPDTESNTINGMLQG